MRIARRVQRVIHDGLQFSLRIMLRQQRGTGTAGGEALVQSFGDEGMSFPSVNRSG